MTVLTMKSTQWWRKRCAVIVMLVLSAFSISLPMFAQNNGQGNSQTNRRTQVPLPDVLREPSGRDSYDPVFTQRRVKALNSERQKQLVSDTNKLLHLTQELHDEVALSNQGAWTPDQMRKLGEIEKLAHSVRDRMTTAVSLTSPLSAPEMMNAPLVFH